ncbi:class I SAM-dependent methyltransferase [Streptomyces sp. NPDC002537]
MAEDPTATPAAARRERRHVFGEVAEQYDTFRPGYPDRLVTDVLDYARLDGAPAVEVGAGTGKATLAFAARGIPVTCVEPDPQMVGVLTRRCAGTPHVTVDVDNFETWRPAAPYGLLYSAQAWHWVDPETRWARARAALRPGGTVALFWNEWTVAGDGVEEELAAVHDRHLADELPNAFHELRPRWRVPGAESSVHREMAADGGFTDVTYQEYDSVHEYSARGLSDLLASHSGYRMLPEALREVVLTDVRRVIEAHGGTARLDTITGLFLSRTAE